MATTSCSLKDEVEQLVLEQIYAFKQTAAMNDHDIFEYHLRHYKIMTIYDQLDCSTRRTIQEIERESALG